MSICTAIMIAASTLGSATALNQDQAKQAKQTMQNLQGAWQLVWIEQHGEKFTPDVLGNIRLIIEGNKRTLTRGKRIIAVTTFTLDPKNPNVMDIDVTHGRYSGKTLPGIYEVSNNTLRHCVALIGKHPPKMFATKLGDGYIVQVFKRVKN